LVPALQLAGRTTVTAMRDGGSATGRHRLRGALVIAELALAVVLLTGAGLLLKSFLRLQQVDPGFQTAHLVMFRVSLPESRYAEPTRRLQFFERALERLRRLPGVDSAAIVDRIPVAGGGSGAWLNITGRPLPAQQTPPVVRYQVVSPEYFQTMGIRLVRGRLLTVDDRADHTPSVVISRSLARRFWPSEDPIGRTVVLGSAISMSSSARRQTSRTSHGRPPARFRRWTPPCPCSASARSRKSYRRRWRRCARRRCC
jgi:putative ABC transport system permease protein